MLNVAVWVVSQLVFRQHTPMIFLLFLTLHFFFNFAWKNERQNYAGIPASSALPNVAFVTTCSREFFARYFFSVILLSTA